MFSQPPGFPKVGVVDPESSRPGTATSANWFSGPDDLDWAPQISLNSEAVELDAGDKPTSVEEELLVNVTIPPSFQTVSCSVALEDISQLLLEVPSTQPRRCRTSESQVQPPELLGSKDAEFEVVLPTLLCLVPGCRLKCRRPLVSLGDNAWLPLLTNRHISWGIVPQQLHCPALRWRQRSRTQWLSTVCRRYSFGVLEPTRLGHQGPPQFALVGGAS